jgi:transposase
MWTPTTRQQHSRPVTRYQTDLTNAEWRVIAPHLPKPCATGRPRSWPMREIVNGIFYIMRAGCPWRLLPNDLPPWGTIYRVSLRTVAIRHMRKIKGYLPLCRLPSPSVLRTVARVSPGADSHQRGSARSIRLRATPRWLRAGSKIFGVRRRVLERRRSTQARPGPIPGRPRIGLAMIAAIGVGYRHRRF